MKLNIGCGVKKISGMINVDIDSACRPDLLCDATSLPLADNSVEYIRCNAVLEHCPEPYLIVKEVHRVLMFEGLFEGWVPFLSGYHGARLYKDYYRYTPDGLAYLLRDFWVVNLKPSSGYCSTLAALLPLPKGLRPLMRLADKCIKSNTVVGYNFNAIK